MLNIITVGYNSGETLYKSVLSFQPDSVYIALHSDNELTRDAAFRVSNYVNNTSIISHYTNRGLAKSWNDGIRFFQEKYPDEGVLLLNDDIIANDNSHSIVKKAIQRYKYSPNIGAIRFSGLNVRHNQVVEHGYACIYLTKTALQEVGPFDENFIPAYFEDIDYERRLMLSGLNSVIMDNTDITHLGSATIFNDAELQYATYTNFFERNKLYYIHKWGGEQNEETFTTPFNK